MKRNKELTPAWVVDYDAPRAQAIRWLGDRYLLAKPINRMQGGWRTLPAALGSIPAALGSIPAALDSIPADVTDAPASSTEH